MSFVYLVTLFLSVLSCGLPRGDWCPSVWHVLSLPAACWMELPIQISNMDPLCPPFLSLRFLLLYCLSFQSVPGLTACVNGPLVCIAVAPLHIAAAVLTRAFSHSISIDRDARCVAIFFAFAHSSWFSFLYLHYFVPPNVIISTFSDRSFTSCFQLPVQYSHMYLLCKTGRKESCVTIFEGQLVFTTLYYITVYCIHTTFLA